MDSTVLTVVAPEAPAPPSIAVCPAIRVAVTRVEVKVTFRPVLSTVTLVLVRVVLSPALSTVTLVEVKETVAREADGEK